MVSDGTWCQKKKKKNYRGGWKGSYSSFFFVREHQGLGRGCDPYPGGDVKVRLESDLRLEGGPILGDGDEGMGGGVIIIGS